MKKVLVLVLVFISVAGYGQNHIKFRDIEINGNLSQFVSQLEKIGYSLKTSEGNTSKLNGIFLGKEGELFVVSTPKTKTVWKVGFDFCKDENWISLKSDYKSLKEQITKKYGEPFETIEFFSSPYYDGDGNEIQAFKKGKCVFASYWEVESGFIDIGITDSCQIRISYEDKINAEIKSRESCEKIQDEI
jgi:hypothetical protein